jgi:SpoVK/Ycf46/Vps4 family AAA+-type ATPase
MSDLVKIVIASAGFSAVFSAAIIWLFKSWISERLKNAIAHEYAQKLETHKAQLQAASGIELEQLKSKLQIAASERNIKLTSTFERQAETIATVYRQLLALQDATENIRGVLMSTEEPNKIELQDALGKANREFADFFFPHEIYLPIETAKKIHKFALTLKQMLHDQHFVKILESHPATNPALQESLKRRYESLDKKEMDIPELLTSLKDDFQKILGIPMPENEK